MIVQPIFRSELMNSLLSQTQQWQPALHLQGDRKILAILLVQLEETEEQIESLEQFHTVLLDRITSIQENQNHPCTPEVSHAMAQ